MLINRIDKRTYLDDPVFHHREFRAGERAVILLQQVHSKARTAGEDTGSTLKDRLSVSNFIIPTKK